MVYINIYSAWGQWSEKTGWMLFYMVLFEDMYISMIAYKIDYNKLYKNISMTRIGRYMWDQDCQDCAEYEINTYGTLAVSDLSRFDPGKWLYWAASEKEIYH